MVLGRDVLALTSSQLCFCLAEEVANPRCQWFSPVASCPWRRLGERLPLLGRRVPAGWPEAPPGSQHLRGSGQSSIHPDRVWPSARKEKCHRHGGQSLRGALHGEPLGMAVLRVAAMPACWGEVGTSCMACPALLPSEASGVTWG